MIKGWATKSFFCVGGMESRKEGENGWSNGYSSGPVFKRQLSKAQLRQHNSRHVCGVPPPEPHASSQTGVWRVTVCVCVWAREVWCRPLRWGADALPTSTLPACLPASWAAASWMRWRDAARSAYLTRSLACSPSALFLSSSLTLSLCTLTGCVPFPLASSSLLSSSSYIISYVRVSCCSLVALRAVCSQQKGFPASLHKVEFTDGNAIHPTLQKHISFSCHPSFYLPLSMSTYRALLSMVASMVFAVVMTNLLVDAFCRGQRSVLETTVVKKHWQRTCITQRNEDLLCLVYIKQFKQFAVECVTSQ